MRGLFALASITLFAGYAVALASSSAIAHILQNRWARCLNESYQVTRTQTPDKNAAAELAFQACSTEEQAFYASDPARNRFTDAIDASLKSAMKRLLIDEGHLNMLPER